MKQLSPQGEALIKSFERLELVGYPDVGGIPTAGWGHVGPEVQIGQNYSQNQCETWFLADTAGACRAINSTVYVALTQDQFDALVSFTFNVGAGSEAHSTLLRLLNGGNLAAAADQFLAWNKVKGVVSAGLSRRRVAERALFLGLS